MLTMGFCHLEDPKGSSTSKPPVWIIHWLLPCIIPLRLRTRWPLVVPVCPPGGAVVHCVAPQAAGLGEERHLVHPPPAGCVDPLPQSLPIYTPEPRMLFLTLHNLHKMPLSFLPGSGQTI